MMWHRSFVAILLLAALCGCSRPAVGAEPTQDLSITRAVAGDSRVWVLTASGVLSSIPFDSLAIAPEKTDGPVLDVCSRAGSTFIAVGERAAKEWSIERLSADKWVLQQHVPRQGDEFIALACDSNATTLLTSRRLVTISDGVQHSSALSRHLPTENVASVFATPTSVFVGINAGEWGGGLVHIDRHSGRVKVIQSSGSGHVCEGPLNTDCDPVTAITSDPWRSDCIVVAIGLVHMSSHGRIDEVCGAHVKRLYYRAAKHQVNPDCKDPTGEPCETQPFFGVAARGDRIVAVGTGGLYSINSNGDASVTALPSFHPAGDVYVTYDVPGFVLVLTDVNRRRSVSGSVPLLVAR